MRKVTRGRYYGRTEVAGALATMSVDLERLVKSCEHYKFGGKRLPAKLRKEYDHIQAIWYDVVHIPVLPDEKLLAKVKRKKDKAKGV